MNRSEVQTTSGSTSSSLIGRVKANDSVAWQQMSRIYGPLVYRWARQAGLQDSDATDIGQEVFRTVAARLADFDHEHPEATFRGWLWTIAHHKLGHYFRRSDRHPEAQGGTEAQHRFQELPASPPEASDVSLELAAHAGLASRAAELVRCDFEPTTWQAFWRVTVDGLSPAEVAAELGLSAAVVRQAKYRVLKRLREELGRP